MNLPSPTSPAADEQAALWAARLEGSVLSAADRAALDAWLASDPAHRPLLSAYCQFSADLEQQLPLLAGVRDDLAETPTARETARSFPWSRWPALAGATLAAAAALAVFLWPGQPQNHLQNLGTPVATRQSHTLADGSVLELNAQTAAVVAFTATERRVRLAGGEAFFRVTHDPARPFFVETPAGSVRVTGTEFNVLTASSGRLEVTVRAGTVEVRPGDETTRSLVAGDRLVRTDQAVAQTALTPSQLDDTLAWRQGQVVFADTPLRGALDRFATYHGRRISASESAALKRVGGRYSLDDLDGFLADLESALGVHATRAPDGTIVVSDAPGA
ncbi:fec operon regulator FecR [Lacunisphaera limnophila]|uniref:Fec operon regulator FecR n=1 Tax=Lacunisphaera limnophila TaxID=1838286 RepID=A0A1D8AVP0_9BACT|nr:FecR domain-containing protein [Lacunisphaera limnophila]AOS44952.1 fec operon regulator FecR [Lacunisphaera limnophila]